MRSKVCGEIFSHLHHLHMGEGQPCSRPLLLCQQPALSLSSLPTTSLGLWSWLRERECVCCC